MTVKFIMFWILFFSAGISKAQLTHDQKDSIAKNLSPISDKSIVYIIRPTIYGFAVQVNVTCDSSYIGMPAAKRYIYTILNPGKHTFYSNSAKFKLDLILKPNTIYYLRQEIDMGVFVASTYLTQLNEKDGTKYLNRCSLAKDNTYTN